MLQQARLVWVKAGCLKNEIREYQYYPHWLISNVGNSCKNQLWKERTTPRCFDLLFGPHKISVAFVEPTITSRRFQMQPVDRVRNRSPAVKTRAAARLKCVRWKCSRLFKWNFWLSTTQIESNRFFNYYTNHYQCNICRIHSHGSYRYINAPIFSPCGSAGFHKQANEYWKSKFPANMSQIN